MCAWCSLPDGAPVLLYHEEGHKLSSRKTAAGASRKRKARGPCSATQQATVEPPRLPSHIHAVQITLHVLHSQHPSPPPLAPPQGVFVMLLNNELFDEPEKSNCAALLAFCSMLWATEAIPLFTTAILVRPPVPCVLSPCPVLFLNRTWCGNG